MDELHVLLANAAACRLCSAWNGGWSKPGPCDINDLATEMQHPATDELSQAGVLPLYSLRNSLYLVGFEGVVSKGHRCRAAALSMHLNSQGVCRQFALPPGHAREHGLGAERVVKDATCAAAASRLLHPLRG